MKLDFFAKLLLFFGLLLTMMGGFMDMYGIEKFYISKQHIFNDGIVLLILTLLYLNIFKSC